MKKSNKQKIETLLLYCTQREVAEMLGITEWAFIYRLKTWNFDERHEKLISKLKPLKQIVLILSSQFMKDHPRAGEPTQFREKILSGLGKDEELVATCFQKPPIKLHTIRAKYQEWVEKIAAVNRGEAFLRVVTWSGKPYQSPWVDVAVLDKDSGCGVQELVYYRKESWPSPIYHSPKVDNIRFDNIELLASNDGLSLDDFRAWFKGYDLSKSMAIIQFTKFRY